MTNSRAVKIHRYSDGKIGIDMAGFVPVWADLQKEFNELLLRLIRAETTERDLAVLAALGKNVLIEHWDDSGHQQTWSEWKLKEVPAP